MIFIGKEYYSMSFSPATLATQFAVVAVSNGITDVALNMPAEVEYLGRNQTELNVKLKQYQVFQVYNISYKVYTCRQ